MTPVAFLYFRIIRPRFCARFKRCPLYATLPSHLVTRTDTHSVQPSKTRWRLWWHAWCYSGKNRETA